MRESRGPTKILAGRPTLHHLNLVVGSDTNAGELIRMPVGRQNSGPLWADGSIALRVRDRRQRSWRAAKVRRPFAVIGSHPAADVVIARPGVEPHHVFLFLDRRGLFAVDLRTEAGTRFAGSQAEASWLGAGDLIELGEHTIEVMQLRVGGSVLSGPLSDDDPLGLLDVGPDGSRAALTLRLLDAADANWSIGSSLVFLGRGPACAVRLADESVAATHSAILRHGPSAYLVPFPGEAARVNGEPIGVGVRLQNADVLDIGRDSLLVQAHELAPADPGISYEQIAQRLELAVGPEPASDVGFAFQDHARSADPGPVDYPALIGRLQAETAALIGVLLRRIEALDEEMAALRARLESEEQARADAAPPPVEKLRWDLIPRPEPGTVESNQSGAWLINRLRELEAERRTAWSSLVGRLGSGKPLS